MKKIFTYKTLIVLLLLSYSFGNAQLKFTNLDSLFAYADKLSVSSKISAQQNLLAKWTKVAALANSINFRNPVTFTSTDNLKLPINFIPTEAFGGPAGGFRQITLGQQYVSNFNFNPQIDIINPQNIARIKSGQLNEELTHLNNNIIKKSLHESIAAAFYNCISLNEQIKYFEKNIELADSIYLIVKNKFDLGITRQQDLNNAKVNSLTVKDKWQQLKSNLEQQQNALKVLCDISPGTQVLLSSSENLNTEADNKSNSNLETRYALVQNEYLKNELRANRLSMMPVLSLVYYQGWQQNSNNKLFDGNAKWIESKYLGFRITLPFPADVNKFSQNYTSKINFNISGLSSAHTQLLNEANNRNTELDYQKTKSSLETNLEILDLKTFNYQKSLNQYKEGVLNLDILFNAFTDMLNSQINTAAAQGTFNFIQAKIKINNSIK